MGIPNKWILEIHNFLLVNVHMHLRICTLSKGFAPSNQTNQIITILYNNKVEEGSGFGAHAAVAH